jgi:hypothetical protein
MVVSVLSTCEQCHAVIVTPWVQFLQTVWTDVTSCECCGSSIEVFADVVCHNCNTRFEVTLHRT